MARGWLGNGWFCWMFGLILGATSGSKDKAARAELARSLGETSSFLLVSVNRSTPSFVHGNDPVREAGHRLGLVPHQVRRVGPIFTKGVEFAARAIACARGPQHDRLRGDLGSAPWETET